MIFTVIGDMCTKIWSQLNYFLTKKANIRVAIKNKYIHTNLSIIYFQEYSTNCKIYWFKNIFLVEWQRLGIFLIAELHESLAAKIIGKKKTKYNFTIFNKNSLMNSGIHCTVKNLNQLMIKYVFIS